MNETPPYREAPLPDEVMEARAEAKSEEEAVKPRIEPELKAAFQEARKVLRELADLHRHVAEATDLDLEQEPGSRPLALWEASAAAIGLANALVDLGELGYTIQALPTYRALHEMLGVISVLNDENEEDFLNRWLGNEEVRQGEVRAAATRQSKGLPEHTGDAGEIMRRLYRLLSDSSHGRRQRVRDYISPSLRRAITGPHAPYRQRLAFAQVAIGLVDQVAMVVGDALTTLYRGDFYKEVIQPLHARMESVEARLGAVGRSL